MTPFLLSAVYLHRFLFSTFYLQSACNVHTLTLSMASCRLTNGLLMCEEWGNCMEQMQLALQTLLKVIQMDLFGLFLISPSWLTQNRPAFSSAGRPAIDKWPLCAHACPALRA